VTDSLSHNLSGALALAARKGGLERIDQVVLNENASRVFALQDGAPLQRFANMDVVAGINTPLAQSSADWMQVQVPIVCDKQTLMPQPANVEVASPSM
jgi:hypothetical protein